MSVSKRGRVFLTNSRYEGTWNSATKSMDGFGTYNYPDGSEYRGFFRNGHFQGYGTLKLRYPQPIIILGTFDKGHCSFIHDLKFRDGLVFKGTLNDDATINSKDWNYLTKQDRRFQIERRYGIEPCGPNAYLTAQRKPRILPKGTFDTSYGVYYPHSGFVKVLEETGQQNKDHFLSCVETRAEILKHNRSYRGEFQPKTSYKKFSHQIIACNIEAVADQEDTANCVCRFTFNRNRYFSTLCPEHLKEVDSSQSASESDGQSSAFDITASSTTIDSMELGNEYPCHTDKMQMQNSQDAGRAVDENGVEVTN